MKSAQSLPKGQMMLNVKVSKSSHTDRSIVVYFALFLLSFLLFAILHRLQAQRVGDGAEYYAMYLAWKDTLRPWMSAVSFGSYNDLVATNSISAMVSEDWLKNAFPALRLGAEADFNHFWFYSALAFAPAKLLSILGITISPHSAFLAVHFLLFFITACVSYRLYGIYGIAVFVLMTVFSPMLWFSNKVHTEFFTYCVTLMGVMLVYSRKYLLGALLIALAATQNPSFALVAFIPFAYRFTLERDKKFSILEVCLVVATAFTVMAHPVYYFLRFGVLTPQLLAGGASLGENISSFYIWLIDPDLGLFPNWPVGVLSIVLAAILFKYSPAEKLNPASSMPFWIFIALFFAVNFFAHSSTENLNSGATPGLARYSLWYLPLFFPVCYYMVRSLPQGKLTRTALIAVFTFFGAASIAANNPKKPENYSDPTRLSNLIQSRTPYLYSPPAEVFSERYSGVGELIQSLHPRGVLGPDCHKLLIFQGDDRELITTPPSCSIDANKIKSLAAERWAHVSRDQYVHLSDQDYEAVKFTLSPGKYSIGSSGTGNFILQSGWHQVEPWGVWSRKKISTLSIPCSKTLSENSKELTFELRLELRPFSTQHLKIHQANNLLFEGDVTEPQTISIHPALSQCTGSNIDIIIDTSNPVSPAELGVANDTRKLGIGFSGFNVQ